MTSQERVWDADHAAVIYVEKAAGGLKLTIDEDPTNIMGDLSSVTLDLRGVRALRLALTRYEKHAKHDQEGN